MFSVTSVSEMSACVVYLKQLVDAPLAIQGCGLGQGQVATKCMGVTYHLTQLAKSDSHRAKIVRVLHGKTLPF